MPFRLRFIIGMVSDPIDVRSRDPYSHDQYSIQEEYTSDIENIVISKGEIESRIERMGEEITRDYRRRPDTELYAMCILKGAIRFFGQLTPHLEPAGPYSEGVIRATRYSAGGTASDEAEIRYLEPPMIEGSNVLVVEDIVDEGYTLESIIDQIEEYDPNSVEIAVLFDKIDQRKTEIDISYTGFVVPDVFLVGYGLDYDERYRNIDHLATLDPSIID